MHAFDILILVLIGTFAILGAVRGLVSEAFRFAAVIAGLLGAFSGYRRLYPALSFIDAPPVVVTGLSFLLLFLLICFGMLAVGWVVRKVVHLTMLGWADRVLGGVLGVAKALIIAWVLSISLACIPSQRLRQGLMNSTTFAVLRQLPLSLNVPSRLPEDITGLPLKTISPVDKLKGAHERFVAFKNKTDSLTALADSLAARFADTSADSATNAHRRNQESSE
jgi:uncharacterized membrane protein required for colicin V production